MNEGYFRLFLKAKMGIFLNYGGGESHHGGAGRITRSRILLTSPTYCSENVSSTINK